MHVGWDVIYAIIYVFLVVVVVLMLGV